MAIWTPQPGPQAEAAICPADFTFFGGTRGGGKSDCLIGRQLRGAEKYGQHWNGLIVRRKYKDFAELRRRWDELISSGLPAERIGGDQQINFIRFKSGAQVAMPALTRLEMVGDFVGHQYTEISIDECTTFPFFGKMVDKLKGSNRSPHGVPCRMFGSGNPGGPGHNEVKQYFRLGKSGVPPKTVFYDEAGESRVFIPSFLKDNRILCVNDPKYVRKLRSIKDVALRKAWLEGDWDVFIGQAFTFSESVHVIDPIEIPRGAPLYWTFDWGWGKPFSMGWWWVDAYGNIYRFAEWYGSTGEPDEGLRMTDRQIAEGILEREEKLGIRGEKIMRLCDPTCFNKKPDYKGGGQGPSTGEVFAHMGVHMTPGDPSRTLKIRQFREYLSYEVDETGKITRPPHMFIYKTCKDFIRTVPSLCTDEDNPEDIDSDQEDHVYDEACHICMARPVSQEIIKPRPSMYDRRIEQLEKVVTDPWEEEVIRNIQEMNREMGLDDIASDYLIEDRGSKDPVSTRW